jgi:hypothetical protein
MKGIEWMLGFMIMLLIMAVIGATAWQATAGFLGESVTNSAKLTCQKIEAIVNNLQASPAGTVHEFMLPKIKGRMVFSGSKLGLTISTKSFNDTHFIEHYPIHYGQDNQLTIDFNEQNRDVFFARCGDEIFIAQSRSGIPC